MVLQVSGEERSLKAVLLVLLLLFIDSAIVLAVGFSLPWFSLLLIKAFGYWVAFTVLLLMSLAMAYTFILFAGLGVTKISFKLYTLVAPITCVLLLEFAWYAKLVLERLLNTDISFAVIVFLVYAFALLLNIIAILTLLARKRSLC